MNEKRFINDVSEILDTYFGYMGEDEPTEREIKEKDYLVIGVARSQKDAESICEKLNEQNEELIEYSNFSLHDLLDKKNKEIEQLKQDIEYWKQVASHNSNELNVFQHQLIELDDENKQLKQQNKKFEENINHIFNVITELDFAKKEYCNALFRLLGEENDVNKAKKRIKEFLEDD